jgi:hypothetical protein
VALLRASNRLPRWARARCQRGRVSLRHARRRLLSAKQELEDDFLAMSFAARPRLLLMDVAPHEAEAPP